MSKSLSEKFVSRYGETPNFEPSGETSTISAQFDHRCHRDFTDEAVAENLLQTLFAAAFCAPSKSDLQQVSVIRLSAPETRDALAKDNPAIRRLLKAPEFLVWCGDNRRIRRLAAAQGKPFANDHLDAFMNAAVDTAIVMQNFILAAESAGLGCCPVSQVRDNINQLSQLLGLPEHVFPVAGLALGWPALEGRISMRLPNRVTVHENSYLDENLMHEVQKYDTRRANAEPTPDSAQLHTGDFGLNEEYGWSEHRCRQYAKPMRANFGAYIRAQGFDLS